MKEIVRRVLDAMPEGASARRRAERHVAPQKLNFWLHAAEGSLASFGMVLAGGTLFQVLAAHLGVTALMWTVITLIPRFSFVAPLLIAHRAEATARKKRVLLLLGLVGQRLPMLFTVVCVLVLAARAPFLCLVLISVVRLSGSVLASMLSPTYFSLVSETIPGHRLGRLMAVRSTLAAVLSIPAGPLCGLVLAIVAFPGNYVAIYSFAFLITMVSWFLFAMVDEVPESSVPRRQQRAGEYLKDLAAALRDDRNYRMYLLYNTIAQLTIAVNAWYAWTAMRRFGMSDAVAATTFLIAGSVGKVAGNVVFRFVAERIGYRRTIGVGMFLRAAGALVAAYAPSGGWLVPAWLLVCFGISARTVCMTPFLRRIAPRKRRVGYATLSGVIRGSVGIVTVLLAGLVMHAFGPTVLFSIGAAGAFASLLPLKACVPPPRPEEQEEGGPEPAPS